MRNVVPSSVGVSASIVRSSKRTEADDHACGEHEDGYATGIGAVARDIPAKSSGGRPSNCIAGIERAVDDEVEAIPAP